VYLSAEIDYGIFCNCVCLHVDKFRNLCDPSGSLFYLSLAIPNLVNYEGEVKTEWKAKVDAAWNLTGLDRKIQ